jgi:hypothetical protein
MRFQYPLKLSFKLIAMAPQIYVRDANGNNLMYVKQKLLKLKEDIGVYTDQSKSQQLFNINADRVIDWSARYHFTSKFNGKRFGSVKREGMRSLWRASYKIANAAEQDTHLIKEGNPWTKVMDGLLGEVPVLGMFSGYLFHPEYLVLPVGYDTPVMRMKKQPAFFEGVFNIEALYELDDDAETRLLLSFIMMLLLERRRG